MASFNESEAETKHGEEASEMDTYFSVKTWKENLTLVVEGKELHVCKGVLASLSPVFDRMFSADFKKKTIDRLTLPDKEFWSFYEFLCCVYPRVDKEITVKNVDYILPLVEEYQVQSSKNVCEALLLNSVNSTATIDDVFSCLSLAMTCRLGKLKSRCIEIASERDLSEVMRGKQSYSIPPEVHEEVLTMKVRRLELDVKEYSKALNVARRLSKDLHSFTEHVLNNCIPEPVQIQQYRYGGGSFFGERVTSANKTSVENARNKIKALRFSRKLQDKTNTKSLLKTCHELPKDDIETIMQEDVTQFLPSDIKDFILKKTPNPPTDYLWN